MMIRLLVAAVLWQSAHLAAAQTMKLRVQTSVVLPKDSVVRTQLLLDLEKFLIASQLPNEQNAYVYTPEKIETFVLLDEFHGLEESKKYSNKEFYKPVLVNAVPIDSSRYYLQVSYIGVMNDEPLVRANVVLIAHKEASQFRFASPLRYNTSTWKTETCGNNTFHYKTVINAKKFEEFCTYAASYDAKLNSGHKSVEIYLTDTMTELLHLLGVDFKSDLSGQSNGGLTAVVGDHKLLLMGYGNSAFDRFDPHDLFHDRLTLLVSRRSVNKSVDEGCAYLYGGSWGFTWTEILDSFLTQIASNRATDWVALKEKPVFFTTGEYQNSADYIVNSLIVQKIEAQRGFKGVWSLLSTGPAEPGNKKYYEELEKLTGITKETYNEYVWQLIKPLLK